MAMPETKEMQTNLETFGKELNENIETINVEFNNKLQEYQKTANTLTDAVRAVTGQTPMEYLRGMRLDEARRMLDSHPGPARLCEEAGGTAPADYRESQGCHRQDRRCGRLSLRVRHLGRFAGLFRRGRADGPRSRGAQGAGHYRAGRRLCRRRRRGRFGFGGRRFEIIPHAGRRIFPPGGGPHGRTLSGVRFFIGSKVVRNSSNCPKTVLFGPIYADYCYICQNVSEQ